jgi:hypothetical protein
VTPVRRLARVAALVAVPLVTVAALAAPAVPALAASASSHPDIGEDAGPGLTVVETIGLFVLIPLGVVALVYILVFAFSAHGPRYRPGIAWQGPPRWWGAPRSDDAAQLEARVESATPLEGAGGARAHW